MKYNKNRKDLVYGAKSHIKSILAGLEKFKKGSDAEAGYLAEHMEKLKSFYIDKIIHYKEVSL